MGEDGFAFGSHYRATLSKYDFKRHLYKVRVAAEATDVLDAWPVGDKAAPIIGTEAWYRKSSQKIGTIEGFVFNRDVDLEIAVRDVEYVNGSNFIVKILCPRMRQKHSAVSARLSRSC